MLIQCYLADDPVEDDHVWRKTMAAIRRTELSPVRSMRRGAGLLTVLSEWRCVSSPSEVGPGGGDYPVSGKAGSCEIFSSTGVLGLGWAKRRIPPLVDCGERSA